MTERLEIGRVSTRPADSAESRLELIARIEHELLTQQSRASFVVHSFAVPRVPAERLIGAEAQGSALLWAPPGPEEASGLGAAFTLSASGVERFQHIQSQARAAWAEIDASRCDASSPALRFFGGFAFQPAQAEAGLWRGFGDARFVLPELSYLKNESGAWLRLIVPSQGWDKARFRAELEPRLIGALHALFSVPVPARRPRELSREQSSEDAWTELVTAIQTEIERGHVQKIVAARRLSLVLDGTLAPELVLARLREDAPESTRFAFRVGPATFLGATPEQLVQKHRLELCTEAVAGSISADDATAAERLLGSEKDGREHDFVVREILRLLAPLSRELSPAAEREVHRLRTVLHLRTKIRGLLREPMHVLELVGRLHPTPAVAGVPTRQAIDFITQHEPHARGWYCGPLGWFDAEGDGRFVVALRSGLVAGNRAELYAGAGIVQDSSARSEFAETRWKLAALLGALGVAG